jgi:hypothetical protein
VKRFQHHKTGDIAFSDYEGSRDYVFWATTSAVYAAAKSLGELTISKGEKPWRKRKFPSAKKGKDAYKLQRQPAKLGVLKNESVNREVTLQKVDISILRMVRV